MQPPQAPEPRPFRRIAFAALALDVLALTAVLGTAWSLRSEAHEVHQHEHGKSSSYIFSNDSDEDFSYAVLDPSEHTTTGMTHDRDWKDLQRLRERFDRRTLWFAIEDREYVVRDAALIEEADEIMEPMVKLGEQQGRLGAIQGRLGAQQGQLGAQQGRLGAEQARLSARLVLLSMNGKDDDDDEREDVEREMERLGRAQEELGRKQEPLGRRQEELGLKQEELGRLQEKASKQAAREMRRFAEDAIASGKAERYRD